MKYFLLLLTTSAFGAPEIGSCINLATAKTADYSYLYRVTGESEASYEGEHVIFGVSKTLSKSLGFVEVDCPSDGKKQAWVNKLKGFISKPKT